MSGAPRVVLYAALAAVALAASLQAGATRLDSGIHGFADAPGVCEAPIDPKCAARAPRIEIRRVGFAELVRRVQLGPAGRFRVALAPDRYDVRLVSKAEHRTIARRVVRVRPHEFTRVVLRASTTNR